MDAARWERVQAMFHEAAELEEASRVGFLERACGEDQTLRTEVQRMLDQDARWTLLDRDVTEVASDLLGGALSSSFRESSPYRIQRVLGEGGMGVVYLAERTDLGNLVAIKILRDGWLSPERRSRFAAEQRMLAQLNHPSIARLYDASTLPDGTPWFVMEYVDGVPLTEYCRQNHCSLEQRLRLIRAVAEAVQYAHEHGVVHRDLKPSNILVKADGSLRLLDFGIAKQLNSDGAALQTRTQFRPMTPAYASPEQLRGEQVGVWTDVYSLGVVLYELLAGKLPFDLKDKTPWEAEALIVTANPANPSVVARQSGLKAADARLDAVCLTAMDKDPRRRYASVAALVRDLDHYLSDEPLETRRDSLRWQFSSFARRNARIISATAAILVLLAAAVSLTLAFSRKAAYAPARSRTVAVIPFQNLGADHDLDFLSQALADEIWRTLSNARSLSLRLPDEARKYSGAARDPQRAGRELHVNTIASGHFLQTGNQLQVTLDLTDVESNRMVWSDVFDVPAGNLEAMQAQVVAKTRKAMAPVLGASEFASEKSPTPKNEEAYRLYLQANALNADQGKAAEIIAMLKRSVALDPSYAPAWERLASAYLYPLWWQNNKEAMAEQRVARERAAALDPENVILQADWLYDRSTPIFAHTRSALTKGQAYHKMDELLRRRPDMARLHFLASWVARDAGALDDAARECEASILIDARDAGARSCGVTFMQRGDYARARDYLRLDPDSDVSKAMTIDLLLREAKPEEALRALESFLPKWGGYAMLEAYLEHHPAQEIAKMAHDLEPGLDPEVSYFSAAHLAYVGQPEAALEMLKRTIDGGYCSFPAVNLDPMFRSVRGMSQFAAVEAAGMACQTEFQEQRGR